MLQFGVDIARHMATHLLPIRMSTLVTELPLSVHKRGLNVVVGIADFVAPSPVPDFEISDFVLSFVNKAVGVPSSGPEACAHPGR